MHTVVFPWIITVCRNLNMTSQSLGLSRELKQYQKRHNRKKHRLRGGEKKAYNAQASSTAAAQFWNPHHLVTSFLCCTELQILCAHMHTHTQTHTCAYTHIAHCVHLLIAYARVFVYPKRSHRRFVGAGYLCRLKFARDRKTERDSQLNSVVCT